jgi:hypothetical protein
MPGRHGAAGVARGRHQHQRRRPRRARARAHQRPSVRAATSLKARGGRGTAPAARRRRIVEPRSGTGKSSASRASASQPRASSPANQGASASSAASASEATERQPGSIGGIRSGTYRPPSGARPPQEGLLEADAEPLRRSRVLTKRGASAHGRRGPTRQGPACGPGSPRLAARSTSASTALAVGSGAGAGTGDPHLAHRVAAVHQRVATRPPGRPAGGRPAGCAARRPRASRRRRRASTNATSRTRRPAARSAAHR